MKIFKSGKVYKYKPIMLNTTKWKRLIIYVWKKTFTVNKSFIYGVCPNRTIPWPLHLYWTLYDSQRIQSWHAKIWNDIFHTLCLVGRNCSKPKNNLYVLESGTKSGRLSRICKLFDRSTRDSTNLSSYSNLTYNKWKIEFKYKSKSN